MRIENLQSPQIKNYQPIEGGERDILLVILLVASAVCCVVGGVSGPVGISLTRMIAGGGLFLFATLFVQIALSDPINGHRFKPVSWIKAFWQRNIRGYSLWCQLDGNKVLYDIYPSWWKPGLILDQKRRETTGEIEEFDPRFAIVAPLGGKRKCGIWNHGPFHTGAGHWWNSAWKVELVKFDHRGIEVRVSDDRGDSVTRLIHEAVDFLSSQDDQRPYFTCGSHEPPQRWSTMVEESMRRIRRHDSQLRNVVQDTAAPLLAQIADLSLRPTQRALSEREECIIEAIRRIADTKRFIHSKEGAAVRLWLVEQLLFFMGQGDPRRAQWEEELTRILAETLQSRSRVPIQRAAL
jgi:hypothetical protein